MSGNGSAELLGSPPPGKVPHFVFSDGTIFSREPFLRRVNLGLGPAVPAWLLQAQLLHWSSHHVEPIIIASQLPNFMGVAYNARPRVTWTEKKDQGATL